MILRRLFLATSAVVTVAGIVTACSSVPDFTFEDDAGNVTPLPDGRVPDVSNDTNVKTDGGGSDVTADSAKDAPICTPSNGGVEDCDDGLDNDCNGKTDCADTACTTLYQCIPTPPIGWTLVAESDNTQPMCPTDYATARDIDVVSGTGAGTCSCSCALTNAAEACNLQQSSVLIATTAACSSAANGAQTPQNVSANATNCTALTTNIDLPNPNSFGQVTAPVPPPSGCTATVAKDNTFPQITAGRTCTPTAPEPAGGGCGIGQVCARKPGVAGLALCIQKAGVNVCPTAGYTTRKTAGGETLADGGVVDGGATVDNRSCNTCNCLSPTCTNASVTLSDQADCTTGGNKNTSGAITTACGSTTNKNFTATHYKSSITAGGCTPNAFNPASTNGIAFTDTTTICCQ